MLEDQTFEIFFAKSAKEEGEGGSENSYCFICIMYYYMLLYVIIICYYIICIIGIIIIPTLYVLWLFVSRVSSIRKQAHI